MEKPDGTVDSAREDDVDAERSAAEESTAEESTADGSGGDGTTGDGTPGVGLPGVGLPGVGLIAVRSGGEDLLCGGVAASRLASAPGEE
jgi:hypothetical protein